MVADIRGLSLDQDRLFSVFPVIAMRVAEWPGVSFALISDRTDHLAGSRARSVDDFVAVHPDVATAELARDRAPRKRAVREFVSQVCASALARRFVDEVCTRWVVPEFAADARLIATELVENTVQHAESAPRLRLELRRGVFRGGGARRQPAASGAGRTPRAG